ncbi:conserved hypothetical protein, partial [Listeria monocytogenes FSL F2-208]
MLWHNPLRQTFLNRSFHHQTHKLEHLDSPLLQVAS